MRDAGGLQRELRQMSVGKVISEISLLRSVGHSDSRIRRPLQESLVSAFLHKLAGQERQCVPAPESTSTEVS